ncbi:dienelactone hydrolase family protein [Sphingomonas sp.]|uniref:dienelactone hydrolase family protein n=1 Tax=Sphingomonas sp. TaxID=28214 RepID=UPI00286B92A4|nr:dienelactone hydrolase family protein [Sphingomonas sp.]
MDQEQRQQAIDLYDVYTHEGMDRRVFMTRMTAIAGSAAAASALVATISANPAAAAIVPATDKRLRTMTTRLGGNNGLPLYTAYTAEPANGAREGSVIVIHENRGLNDHGRDVARRLALSGFHAVAVDWLSPLGGTPADENQAREMIGKLDLTAATSDAVAMLDLLAKRKGGNGKVGVIGFCWGGAFVNRLAVAAGDKLNVGVSYYGVAPDPAEGARVTAPLVIQLASLDDRVNKSAFPWITALRAAGKPVKYFGYDGVNHAFNNDTSAERYNKAASDLAWKRTIAAFKRHLA